MVTCVVLVSLEAEQTGALPIKAVTKTWRKSGTHIPLMGLNSKRAHGETTFGDCYSFKGKTDLEKERACGMRVSHWFPSSGTTKFPTRSWSPAEFPMQRCVGLEIHMDLIPKR